MNRSAGRRRGERGVSAVLVALLLSAVMVVGAFAVDLGAAYTERRHDQNTVDAAVMSGLVQGALKGGVVNDIVAEVRAKVDKTLGTPVPLERWESCSDPGQLFFTTRELRFANPTISPVTDCISFSRGFNELRVRLPDQKVPAIFAPVLGFNEFGVSAEAHGRIEDGGVGGPPFIALSTAGQGDFVCLRTSSSGEPISLMDGRGPKVPPAPGTRPDPCNSSEFAASSSSFGTLLPYRYEAGPSWTACSRNGNASVTGAIAIGIDHIMGLFPNGYDPSLPASASRLDGANNCATAFPNTFEVDTGLAAGELRCALVSRSNSIDCDGITPRFHQGPNFPPSNPATAQRFVGELMDNVAPWQYLRPAQQLFDEGAPPGCVAVASSRTTDSFDLDNRSGAYAVYDDVVDADWDHYDKFDAFIDCVNLWGTEKAPSSGQFWPRNQLFVDELGESPRFGFIPQVWENQIDSHTQYVHIEGFLPVFMYRMYTKSENRMCDPADDRSTTYATHDAGQVFPSRGYQCGSQSNGGKVDRLSSIILACGMMSNELCDKDTSLPASAGHDIYDFRLVR